MLAAFPFTERAVIQHHALPNLVAPGNIVRLHVAHAKVTPCHRQKLCNRCDWGAVVVDHFILHQMAPAASILAAVIIAKPSQLK